MENREGAVENMGIIDSGFWSGKRVFVTGHTGFKGAWLSLWLHKLGANVSGYALHPPTEPSLYELSHISSFMDSTIGDIQDSAKLSEALQRSNPEIVFHLAAQPLVRDSYANPVETYGINVMGTVNLLEGIRNLQSVKAVVNVTTDKCYENKEWYWGYRENEPLGGYDPYSSSKACSELVTSAYRNSFFSSKRYDKHGVGVATARAGNVIGGGDWAKDRLIPDFIRSILENQSIVIRSPDAVRPWQHVLEPLSGYLMLAERLYQDGSHFSEAWNFGPYDHDVKTVRWIVDYLCSQWNKTYEIQSESELHEAGYLKLDSSKARMKLGWRPKWSIERSLQMIMEWTKAYSEGEDMLSFTTDQIASYENLALE